MSNRTDEQSAPGGRPDSSAIVLRSLVLLGPLAAVAATWLAAGRTVPAVAALVLLLSGLCAVHPDSHLGVLVVAAVTIQWLAIVHSHTTPWSIGAAGALAVFHAAHAAATVAPSTAPWTRAMQRRWSRRTAALVIASAVTWSIVALTNTTHPFAGTLLLPASLLLLAAGGLWARHGNTWPRPAE